MNNKKELYDFIDKISNESIYGLNKKNPVEETKKLLNCFNNPQNDFKSIQIVGTNGKTSTSHFLFNILKENDYNVGLYFSPHIYDFEERIQTNDGFISYDEVFHLMKDTYFKAKEIGIENAGFPIIMTVTAFRYFSLKNVQFVVLEAGVGGLYDPTNSVKGDYAIITNIGLDHTHLLGDSIEEIKKHKYGIIKENMYIASNCKDINKYIVQNKFKNTICLNSKENASVSFYDNYLIDNKFVIKEMNLPLLNNLKINDLKLRTIGFYQIENLYNVFTLCHYLNNDGYYLNQNKIIKAINETIVLGRLQLIDKNIILDGTHNELGFLSLIESIDKYYSDKEFVILASMKNNKNIIDINTKLEKISKNIFYTEMWYDEHKKISNMHDLINNKNLNFNYIENPIEAFEYISSNLKENQILLVTGSLYLMAQIQKYIKEKHYLIK